MHYLLNKNIVFAILLLIVFTLVFTFLYLQLNAYAEGLTWDDPEFEKLPDISYDQHIDSTWDNYVLINNQKINETPSFKYFLILSKNTIDYQVDEASSNYPYLGAFINNYNAYDMKVLEYKENWDTDWVSYQDYVISDIDLLGRIIDSNTSIGHYEKYDTYTIAPGETLSFDVNYSVVATSKPMDFEILSGTQYGSMTFYPEDDYQNADFNLFMSSLSSTYLADDIITVNFDDNGTYNFVNNSGYTLKYTDDNTNITINNLVNAGYYTTPIGNTVLLDCTDITTSRTLVAQGDQMSPMILKYTRVDSEGVAVSKTNDSFSSLTLDPDYKYYIQWTNQDYAQNTYVRFTSPVIPQEPDDWSLSPDGGTGIIGMFSPWKEFSIGDNENYFDILSLNQDSFNAVIEMPNAEFKVKHYKYISSSYELHDIYTINNQEEFNLYHWGLEPGIDKLEFYLTRGQANLKISKHAIEDTDYEINMSYKYIDLYDGVTESLGGVSNEYDQLIDDITNDIGHIPTAQEVVDWVNSNETIDNPDFEYSPYGAIDSDILQQPALETIQRSLSTVTTMVGIMFSNPITGLFVTAFGITIPIAIFKFIRG